MLRMDRKLCRDILNLSKSYETFFKYHKDDSHLSAAGKTVKLSIPSKEVYEALHRLESSGLIRHSFWTLNFSVEFQISPELLHYKAFWFDRVSKKYIAGFVSGVLTTVAAGLILHFTAGLF